MVCIMGFLPFLLTNPNQVLFKRKPVHYSPKVSIPEDAEVSPQSILATFVEDIHESLKVWPIEETDEVFTNYEDYLHR